MAIAVVVRTARPRPAALIVAAGAWGVLAPAAAGQWVPNYQYYTIQRIGLFGPAQTGSAGLQTSAVDWFNAQGFIAGRSTRYTGVSTFNGQDAWAWNGTTTTQIGLTGGVNTGSGGHQISEPHFQNAAGYVVGYSGRYTGVNTSIGLDAWYFDPFTMLTSAVVGSIRTTDNYARSFPTILTEGGFLLVNNDYFPGGLGAGEQRAFIFAPTWASPTSATSSTAGSPSKAGAPSQTHISPTPSTPSSATGM